MSERETSKQIEEAATEWVARLDGDPLSEEEQQALDIWLAGDVRRPGALVRMQAVLAHLGRTKALGPGFDPSSEVRGDGSGNSVNSPVSRRWALAGGSAIAASIAVAVLLPGRIARARTFETQRGEVRRLSIGPGLAVTLDTDSKIAIDAAGTVDVVRGVALVEANSAVTVQAGRGALSLSNSLVNFCRLPNAELEATVCRGTASFQQGTSQKVLEQGTKTRFSGNEVATVALDRKALDRLIVWRTGKLAFEDTPLRVAAAQFTRYNSRRLVFADPAIGDEGVTGLFAANDLSGFAKAAAQALNLKVTDTPGAIVLTK